MSESLFEHSSFKLGCNMLSITKVEIELITYCDMYIFFEKGMRGGVSYISNRYSKGSN